MALAGNAKWVGATLFPQLHLIKRFDCSHIKCREGQLYEHWEVIQSNHTCWQCNALSQTTSSSESQNISCFSWQNQKWKCKTGQCQKLKNKEGKGKNKRKKSRNVEYGSNFWLFRCFLRFIKHYYLVLLNITIHCRGAT